MTPSQSAVTIPPLPESPTAVLLDAAGTLIRTARPVGAMYAEVAAHHGARLEGRALTHAFRTVFPAMPPMAFPPASASELDRLERGWWSRLVREVLTVCEARVDDFDAFFTELYDGFASPCAWAPYPEVETTLACLRESGLRLAVVSNFDSRVEAILAGLGLSPHLDAVIYSTRAGAAKPEPAIFCAALETLGVDAGSAVHVGDSREADLVGAARAGICGRLLIRDGEPDGPGEISDLGAFADEVLGRS